MIDQQTLDAVDPGVWRIVRLLNKHGFQTTDSGDGRSKPVAQRTLPGRHVVCKTRPTEMVYQAMRLHQLLAESCTDLGDQPWHVEASFSTEDHTAILLATQPLP